MNVSRDGCFQPPAKPKAICPLDALTKPHCHLLPLPGHIEKKVKTVRDKMSDLKKGKNLNLNCDQPQLSFASQKNPQDTL